MRHMISLGIAALALTACASQVAWAPPPGMSAAMVTKERQACTQEAQRVFAGDSMAGARGGKAQFATPVHNEEAFQKCLTDKGFTKKDE